MKISITGLVAYLFFAGCITAQSDKDIVGEEYNQETTLTMNENDLLIQYLKIPSTSGAEKFAGEFFRDVCSQSGFFITQYGEENGNFNFAASLYPLSKQKPNLIFLNHIDVVPNGELIRWMHPPLEGRVINDEIWGRGAFDNKGMAVIQLSAIARFVKLSKYSELPFNITLLAMSCEETQCPGGARFIIENFLEELNPWAVVGEGPPAFQGVVTSDPERYVFGIATGQKKALWIKLELALQNNSHSSVTPLEYSNQALIKALNGLINEKPKIIFNSQNKKILSDLGKLEGGLKGFVLRNNCLFKPLIKKQLRKKPEIVALFTNSITLTSISNPAIVHNAIPGKTTALLDCRLLPETDTPDFITGLKKKLNHKNITIETVFEGPDGEISNSNHVVYKTLEQAIKNYFGEDSKVVPFFLPNMTDSNWFRSKGIPVFDVSPFRINRDLLNCVHGYDERIPMSGLQEGKEVFTLFIAKLIENLSAGFDYSYKSFYTSKMAEKH